METIQKIETYVENIMQDIIAHDFKHVNRVRNWALKIAKDENFEDIEIVEVAALMHDIGLTKIVRNKNLCSQSQTSSKPKFNRREHGAIGADMAERYLAQNTHLEYQQISEICNSIQFHNKNREGSGELLDIVRDADMMDLFGAIGIMRAFEHFSHKATFDPANVKGETWDMSAKDFDKRFDDGIGAGKTVVDLINFQISCYDNLTTDTAKKIAKPLVEYARDYILHLEKEVDAVS